jgi:anti-anti-sigma factor
MSAVVVALRGELDLAVADCVKAQLVEAAEEAVRVQQPLRVDLRRVTFVDSSGMACLIAALGRLREHDQRLQLAGVAPNVLRVLTLGGFTDLCDLEPA